MPDRPDRQSRIRGSFRRAMICRTVGAFGERAHEPGAPSLAGIPPPDYALMPHWGHLCCKMRTIFRSVPAPTGRQIIARGFIPWSSNAPILSPNGATEFENYVSRRKLSGSVREKYTDTFQEGFPGEKQKRFRAELYPYAD